jgi:CRP-like cAMP-binding protein
MNQMAHDIAYYVEKYQMRDFLNETLIKHLRLFRFAPDSHIFIEQDEQHRLYFLVEGQVQCNHYHANGKVAIFAISSPLTAIGDMEIMSDEPVYSNVIAMRAVTMLGISREAVHRHGSDDPRFLRFLNDQLRRKIYALNALKKHEVRPLRQRLMMYMLSQQMTEEDAIILPDKNDLAAILGSTSRHLNRVLGELVQDGVISDSYPMIRIFGRSVLSDNMDKYRK